MEGEGVQIQEVLGWAPSCCGLSQERGPGSDPSWLLEKALGPGRVRAEESLPLGGQGWTSLRGNWECVAAASTPAERNDNRNYSNRKKSCVTRQVYFSIKFPQAKCSCDLLRCEESENHRISCPMHNILTHNKRLCYAFLNTRENKGLKTNA